MPRQSFGDFLNNSSPGPGRGRGRGRGRGGFDNDRGRGGRGGWGGRGGRGGSFGADYSNVPLDYGSINTKTYNRFEQTSGSVQPFGERGRGRGRGFSSGPGRGSWGSAPGPSTPRRGGAPRGRGRGLGFETPGSTSASGTNTPITGGLGYHRSNPIRGVRVDKFGVVTWGGGAAPLFVKAGELFKEGEVDVVKKDGDSFVIEHYPLNDPSAPQMRNLEDSAEADFASGAETEAVLKAVAASHKRVGLGGQQAWPSEHDFEGLEGVDFSVDKEQFHARVDRDWTQARSNQPVTEDEQDLSIDEKEFQEMADRIDSTQVSADEDGQSEEDVDAVLSEKIESTLVVGETESTSIFSSERTERIVFEGTQSSTPVVSDEIPVISAVAVQEALEVAVPEVTAPTDVELAAPAAEPITVDIVEPATVNSIEPSTTNTVDHIAADIIERSTPISEDDASSSHWTTEESGQDIMELDVPAATEIVLESEGSAMDGGDLDDADDLFFVDTTGDAAEEGSVLYDTTTAATPLGIQDPAATVEDDEEAIIFKPRLITDPVASSSRSSLPHSGENFELTSIRTDRRVSTNRKDRKAAKKEKRARNKRRGRKGTLGGAVGPRDDSDIEWGSDGPPGALDVKSGDSDYHLEDDEIDPELDDEVMRRFGQGMDRIHHDESMPMMDSESDEYSEIDEDVKARHQAAPDPFNVEAVDESGSGSDLSDSEDSGTDNFEALADAYDVEGKDDDEFEEEGEAKMFTGGSGWKDDEDEEEEEEEDGEENNTDWFIKSMEDALDGGAMALNRKERNRTFRSVANGSFDLPTAPAKKDKKGSHIPKELQEQWLRDRAKKAEKKQEREIARALALIDPFVHKGKGKKKKNAKTEAARNAHLINASASEVADMFDAPSDNDDDYTYTRAKRHRPAGVALLPNTLETIDTFIQHFMTVKEQTTLPLGPMPKEQRKKVHMLAECYGLKSVSKGKGTSRAPVLIKAARSGLRNDRLQMRDRLVYSSTPFQKGFKSKGEGGKKAPPRGTGASVRAREGDLVGEGAEKIGQENVGHKLLSLMGWSEGAAIGRTTGGLDVPIVAVVKNTKSGLGA